MSEQKRLFLVDAYALIFRGYYAFIKNPRINSKGEDTSAIMGFMNSLLDVIKRERPDHLAVVLIKVAVQIVLKCLKPIKPIEMKPQKVLKPPFLISAIF